MPGLSTIGDALGLIVFGEAHALHTDSEGRRWGWDAAGDFHETLPNARAITPTGGSADESTRNVALFLPAVQALPRSTVHVSGKYYIFHTALGGNLVQLEMFSGVAGDQDEFQAFADGSKITGFSFSPERMDHEVVPRIGMVLGERQRALFEWQGMSPPAGAKLGFHAVNDRKGVKFENSGSVPATFYMQLTTVDGPSSMALTNRFGPFEVASGAIQTVTIQDWPEASMLQSDLDLNSDGTVDSSQMYTPVSAGPQPEPPTIQASLANGEITVSWPAGDAVFELQSAGSLTQPSWQPVSKPPTLSAEMYHLTLPVTGDAQFFRLKSSE